jgi:hypothetical protein
VVLHLVSKHTPGSVEADVKVGGGDSQLCRDGLSIATLEIDQPNHLGVGWPKLTKESKCAAARGMRARFAPVVDHIDIRDRFHDIRPPRAIVIEDRAMEDAVEPSSGPGRVLQRLRVCRGAQERTLHDVLRVGIGRHAPAHQSDEPRPVCS